MLPSPVMRTSLCFALALASCSSSKDAPKPTPATGSGSGLASVASAKLEIFVDDKSVNLLAVPQLSAWPRVDTLVPVTARRLGTWEVVHLKSQSPAPTDINHPSATYPDLVPVVFLAQDNTASFGMFDPVELAKHGKPMLRVDGITEIRIRSRRVPVAESTNPARAVAPTRWR